MRRTQTALPAAKEDLRARRPELAGVDPTQGIDDIPDGGSTEAPIWRRDAIALSAHARRLLEKIKPVILRVFSFWDHSVTRMNFDDRVLTVDSSGSYRLD